MAMDVCYAAQCLLFLCGLCQATASHHGKAALQAHHLRGLIKPQPYLVVWHVLLLSETHLQRLEVTMFQLLRQQQQKMQQEAAVDAQAVASVTSGCSTGGATDGMPGAGAE